MKFQCGLHEYRLKINKGHKNKDQRFNALSKLSPVQQIMHRLGSHILVATISYFCVRVRYTSLPDSQRMEILVQLNTADHNIYKKKEKKKVLETKPRASAVKCAVKKRVAQAPHRHPIHYWAHSQLWRTTAGQILPKGIGFRR